jgi:oxygen-independent coproporphyrinogen III oxidase
MHVYIHVPFCARRCSYCDFAIAVRREVPSAEYLSLVQREWDLWQQEPVWDESSRVETIYLGGGTPSRLAVGAVAALVDTIGRNRIIEAGAEITLEANPDDVTLESAQGWRAAGVSRISLGVQSFDPAVLAWMHRTHTSEQVPKAVAALRKAQIENLSLDLIFGLPAELGRDWSRDLAFALELQPEHLSLYGLTVEPHTPLGHWTERGAVGPVDEERYALEFLQAHGALTSQGYDHYEVSNAARPGYRARHNSAYWQRAPFIGLGPAAHSGHGRERRWNVRDWSAYRRAVAAGLSPLDTREVLDREAMELEQLYLGLRTSDGIDPDQLSPEHTRAWEAAGWAEVTSDRVTLTPEGWLRLDGLVASAALAQR